MTVSTMKDRLQLAAIAVTEWALPARCVLCLLPSAGEPLCGPCRRDLPRMGYACRQCALPLPAAGDERCGQCLKRPPPFERTVSALSYDDPVPFLVQRFKFGRDFVCGKAISSVLCGAALRSGYRPNAILPVPLHRWRLLSRGFNQASFLAHRLSRVTGVQTLEGRLLRRRHTAAQSGKDAASRRRNIRRAFLCRDPGSELKGRDVVLVDDVMTTGATLRECAMVLKNSGARSVSCWVAARTCL